MIENATEVPRGAVRADLQPNGSWNVWMPGDQLPDPPVVPDPVPPLTPDEFRSRFTNAETLAIANSEDPAVKVLLFKVAVMPSDSDLHDCPSIADDLAHLVSLGLIDAGRIPALIA
jgi:hypothetical protein